jgi:acyl carrier protein
MNLEPRLVNCFSKVFPECPTDLIPSASPATLPGWDSIASITLLNVIEDEFGIPLDLEDIAELSSFKHIAAYLASRLQDF